MQKLRKLETQAAIVIQREFRAFKTQMDETALRSRGTQTDQGPPLVFQRMSETFYQKNCETPADLMQQFRRSFFETYTLYFLVQKTHQKHICQRGSH